MTSNRRTLLRAGLAVTAVSASGVAVPTATAAEGQVAGQAAVAAPTIASCSAWGARAATSAIELLTSKPTKIVVHHTASENSTDYSQAHAYALAREIQGWHMDENGWKDSGQHFTNSRGGYLMEGRHRSLEVLRGRTKHVVGAHTYGQNNVALGIENEGTYTSVDVTDELWTSLVSLCQYMCAQYGISPSNIYGHRDFNNTECPGEVLYGRLPELRNAVAAALSGTAAAEVRAETSWPLLVPGSTGPRVRAAQHLLHSHGLTDVPTDGVFGPATEGALRRFAEQHDIQTEHCYASAHADERGLLGGGSWPLLVRTVRADDPGDAGRAARVLLAAKGTARTSEVIDTRAWKDLLA